MPPPTSSRDWPSTPRSNRVSMSMREVLAGLPRLYNARSSSTHVAVSLSKPSHWQLVICASDGDPWSGTRPCDPGAPRRSGHEPVRGYLPVRPDLPTVPPIYPIIEAVSLAATPCWEIANWHGRSGSDCRRIRAHGDDAHRLVEALPSSAVRRTVHRGNHSNCERRRTAEHLTIERVFCMMRDMFTALGSTRGEVARNRNERRQRHRAAVSCAGASFLIVFLGAAAEKRKLRLISGRSPAGAQGERELFLIVFLMRAWGPDGAGVAPPRTRRASG